MQKLGAAQNGKFEGADPWKAPGTVLPAAPSVPRAGNPQQVCGAVSAAGTDLSTAVRHAVRDPEDSCPP